MKSLPIWQCRKTGECCKRFLSSGPQLTNQEKQTIILSLDTKEIRDHLQSIGIDKEKLTSYIETHNSLPLQNTDTCAFLKNNECIIHNIKPDVCKSYPVYVNKKSDKTEVIVDLGCPRGEDLVKAIEIGNIPESMGIAGDISVSGHYLYEEKIREKYGEDA